MARRPFLQRFHDDVSEAGSGASPESLARKEEAACAAQAASAAAAREQASTPQAAAVATSPVVAVDATYDFGGSLPAGGMAVLGQIRLGSSSTGAGRPRAILQAMGPLAEPDAAEELADDEEPQSSRALSDEADHRHRHAVTRPPQVSTAAHNDPIRHNLQSVLSSRLGHSSCREDLGLGADAWNPGDTRSANRFRDEVAAQVREFEPRLADAEVGELTLDGELNVHFDLTGRDCGEERRYHVTLDSQRGGVVVRRT